MKFYLARFVGLILLFGLVLFVPVSAQQSGFASPILVVNTSFLNVRTGPGAEYSVLVTVVGGTELPVLATVGDGVWYEVATDGGPGWVNVEFTLPRGDFSNVPDVDFQASANSSSLGQGGGAVLSVSSTGSQSPLYLLGASVLGRDVRSEPRSGSLIVYSLLNDPGVVYPVINQTTSEGVQWFQLAIPSIGNVWVDQVTLRPLVCSNETVGVLTQSDIMRFDGLENRAAFTLDVGSEFFTLSTRGDLTLVQLASGIRGYVSTVAIVGRSPNIASVCPNNLSLVGVASLGQGGGAEAVIAAQPVITGNYVVVNTGNLNIRSGPAAEYSVVATAPGGTELAVVGRAEDGVWFLVEGAFGLGWLNNQFTLFRGVYDAIPVIEEAVLPSGADLGQGGGGIANGSSTVSVSSGRNVSGASVNGDLYDAPSYSALKVASAFNDPNTVFPVLGGQFVNGELWTQVGVPSLGAVWTTKATLRPLACGTDSVGVLTRDEGIRFDGFENRASFTLVEGSEFFVVGFRSDLTIVQLADYSVGLVPSEAITPRSNVNSVCTGLPTQSVLAQTSAGSSASVSAPASSSVTSSSYLVINTSSLNARSGPGANFSVVTTVNGGSEWDVIGRTPDGVWLLIEGFFGQAWVNSEFVLFRGNYSVVPVIAY